MKKLLSVLLAVMMLLTAMPVMAEEIVTPATEVEATPVTPATPTVDKDHVCGDDKVTEGDHYSCPAHVVETKEATCTEAAYVKFACQAADCDTEFKVHHGDALGHAPELNTDGTAKGELTKEPTCTEAGEKTFYCTRCKTNYVVKVDAIGHQWANPVVTEATCFADGYTTETCSVCNATQKVAIVAKYEHKGTIETVEVIEDASCDTEGGKVKVVIFEQCVRKDKDGNDVCDYEKAIDETSMYLENLSSYHQKAMEDMIKAQDTKKVDEKGEKIYETKADIAERISKGAAEGTVSFEDAIYVDVKGDNTTHKIALCDAKFVYKKATCTTDGSFTMTCTDEDGVCTANVSFTIPATGHNYSVKVKDIKHAPTCLTDGAVIVNCTNPGCKFEEQIELKAPGAHNFEGTEHYTQVKAFETVKTTNKQLLVDCVPYTVQKECCAKKVVITLSNKETVDYYIGGCVDEDGDPILSEPKTVEATGKHEADPKNYAHKAPTCTEDGFDIFNCVKCGNTHKTVLKAVNHKNADGTSAYKYDEKKDVVLPNCTEDGSITWTCALCKDVKVQIVPKTGHGWDWDVEKEEYRDDYSITIVKKGSCTVDQEEIWNCDYCDATKANTVKAHHSAPEDSKTIVSKDPTCTTTGSVSFTCTVCHKPVTETIKALGHTWERVEGGLHEDYNLPGRNEKIKLPAEYNTTGKTQWYDKEENATCEDLRYYERTCDDPTCPLYNKTTKKAYTEKLEVGELMPHLLVSSQSKLDGKEVKSNLILDTNNLPTCQKAGKAFYNCAYCGEYVEFEIPALPHNETMTWNKTKNCYEFTCQKATVDTYFAKLDNELNYMYDAILACIDTKCKTRKTDAESYQDKVLEDLDRVLGNGTYVVGVGCQALLSEINVNKTHYEASLKDNVVTLKAVENCALLENPWIIVSWAYELSDGTSMTVTLPFATAEVKDAKGAVVKGEHTATIYAPEVDESAKLIQTTVAVTKAASVDLAAAYQTGFGYDKF